MMELEKVQKLIDLAKANNLSELTFKQGEDKIVIVLNKIVTAPASHSVYQSQPLVISPTSQETIAHENLHEIKSPLVGTYYSQAAPGEPVFAKIGDKIKKGQVLCVLEAMKIMNEIESEVAGEIVEVCVDNENLVEFGQVLFRLRT